MTDLRKMIMSELQSAVEAIRANIDAQNINATGATRASIVARDEGNKFAIVQEAGDGAPYWTLEEGAPPHYVTIDKLERWADAKGFSFGSEIEKRQFLFATQRKIAAFGFGRPAPSDFGSVSESVYSPVLSEEWQKSLINKVKRQVGNAVSLKFTEFFKDNF